MQLGGEMAADGVNGGSDGSLGGGGGPSDSGPWPPFFLGDGAGMEEGLHLRAAALEEENSWCLMT